MSLGYRYFILIAVEIKFMSKRVNWIGSYHYETDNMLSAMMDDVKLTSAGYDLRTLKNETKYCNTSTHILHHTSHFFLLR